MPPLFMFRGKHNIYILEVIFEGFLKAVPMLLLGFFLFVPNVFAANSVTRLDGANRYEVAVNVSKQGWSSASTVIVANGKAYATSFQRLHLLTETTRLSY